jgi:xanthine dehydrogenase accessory factor
VTEIYEEIVRLRQEQRSCAVATIVQSFGSTPQKEGAKLLVRDDGSTLGTLGGGCIEAEVVTACRMVMKDGVPRIYPFELTERHGGLVCGGKIHVYIEPVIPRPHLVILGAGHVGKALSTAARFSGFSTTVVDDRAEYANPQNVPDADSVVVSDFGAVFSKVDVCGSAYIVIATRGHNHDLEALKAALRTEARYVGLLGSRRKRAVLFRMLREEGFGPPDLDRVITPVGLPIGSITPEEIAVSIMAQIIQYRRANGAPGLGTGTCSGGLEEDGQTEAAPSPRGQACDTTLP